MTTLILHQKWEKFSIFKTLHAATEVVQVWVDRHHQRKQLAQMTPHLLKDIGLSQAQATEEINKPFWK